MLDCANNVRQIYLGLLNGNLTYNGKNVPVYGETPFVTAPQYYVVIGSITESGNNTNHNFSNDVDVVIDIFAEQYKVYNNSVVDGIASQILNLLIPTTGVKGFADAQFEVYPMSRINSQYLPLQSGQNFVARKIITISNLVNQK
jgi:hypothetical protein